MSRTIERKIYRGNYDDDFYWEQVDRNLGWLGVTEAEQRARQEKLRDAVIGVVGTGGIGGRWPYAWCGWVH